MKKENKQLIEEFHRIANKGWIKSISNSFGSIGLTFEKELGKNPDALYFPDYYGVEFDGGLLYVKKDEVEVYDHHNTDKSNTNGAAVLNYHFFYGEGEDCNESICLDINIFKEHLTYLKENGFKTLTMEEFTKWMYKEIELPEKSVLITVDDGVKGTGKHNGNKLIPALEEYKMHATLFLISGWWDVENYRSKYLDIQSHTYDMHQYGPCKRGQLNCATYEEALKDLKRSLEIVDNANSFCFPFYYYSDSSIKAVQDAGFKIMGIYDDFTFNNIKEDSQRVTYVAQKVK